MRGATILKASDDKTRELNTHTLMAFSGEAGDTGISINSLSDEQIPLTFRNQFSLPSIYKPMYSYTRCAARQT